MALSMPSAEVWKPSLWQSWQVVIGLIWNGLKWRLENLPTPDTGVSAVSMPTVMDEAWGQATPGSCLLGWPFPVGPSVVGWVMLRVAVLSKEHVPSLPFTSMESKGSVLSEDGWVGVETSWERSTPIPWHWPRCPSPEVPINQASESGFQGCVNPSDQTGWRDAASSHSTEMAIDFWLGVMMIVEFFPLSLYTSWKRWSFHRKAKKWKVSLSNALSCCLSGKHSLQWAHWLHRDNPDILSSHPPCTSWPDTQVFF